MKAWNHQVAGDLKSIGVFGLRDHQVKPTIKKSSDLKGCGMPDTKKSAQKPPGYNIMLLGRHCFGLVCEIFAHTHRATN